MRELDDIAKEAAEGWLLESEMMPLAETIRSAIDKALESVLTREPSATVLAEMAVANVSHETMYENDGVRRSLRIYRAMAAALLAEITSK